MSSINHIEEVSHEMELLSTPRMTTTLMRDYFSKTPLVELENRLYSWLCASFPVLPTDIWMLIVQDYIDYSQSINEPNMSIQPRLWYTAPLRSYNTRMNRALLVHTTQSARVLNFVGTPSTLGYEELKFEVVLPVTVGLYPMVNRQRRHLLAPSHPAHAALMEGKSWSKDKVTYQARAALYHLAYTMWGYKFLHTFESYSMDLLLILRYDYNVYRSTWEWNFRGLHLYPRLSALVMERVMNVTRNPPLFGVGDTFYQTEHTDVISPLFRFMEADQTDTELDEDDDETTLIYTDQSDQDPEEFIDDSFIVDDRMNTE